MNRIFRMLLVLSLAAVPLTLVADSDRSAKPISGSTAASPRLLRMIPDAPYPIWVEATTAVDSNNFVHGEYFSDGGEILKTWMKTPSENGCIQIGMAQPSHVEDPDRPQRRDSIQGAVATSPHIIKGTVTEVSTGFHGYVPGTLLTVHVTKTLKGEAPPSTLYAFLPVGQIPFGTQQICKSDPTYIHVPAVGDALVLFTSGFSGEDHRLAIVAQGGDIVGVQHDGHLILPSQYVSADAQTAIVTVHDLTRAVAAISRVSGEK